MPSSTASMIIPIMVLVELICEKPDSLEIFEAFKVKVELQKGKKIKVVHYDRGGEYNG